MKKLLFILAGGMLTAQAAQAYVCQVDLVTRTGRVIDSFVAQTDRNGTCREALRDCNRETRVRNIGGLRCESVPVVSHPTPPNPYPNPNPNPGPIPGQNNIQITAIVENSLITLRGYSNGELFNQCMSSVPHSSVDDILMVTNNNNVIRLRNNSSYWRRPVEICNTIMANVNNAFSRPTAIDVYGSFENRQFTINTSRKTVALEQCYNQTRNLGSIDDIYMSVNNSQMNHLRNNSSYWRNSLEICHVVMNQIDNLTY